MFDALLNRTLSVPVAFLVLVAVVTLFDLVANAFVVLVVLRFARRFRDRRAIRALLREVEFDTAMGVGR